MARKCADLSFARYSLNLMLHAKYGLEMYSNAIITQKDRIQKNPEQCQAIMMASWKA